jgi:hypothetical protein
MLLSDVPYSLGGCMAVKRKVFDLICMFSSIQASDFGVVKMLKCALAWLLG